MDLRAGFAPQRHLACEHLRCLRGVVDAHDDAVVPAALHGCVEDDGDFGDLKAESRGLAGGGYQVEDRDGVG